MSRIVVVGDSLWDVEMRGTATRLAPDAPVPVIEEPRRRERPGGAALAALLATCDGHQVTLLTRLSGDEASYSLRRRLHAEGVDVLEVALTQGSTPVKMRIGTHDQVIARLDSGVAQPQQSDPLTRTFVSAALKGADAVLVSDYGLGLTRDASLRRVLSRAAMPVVWDPHPRGPRPVAGVLVTTPNLLEARAASRMDEPDSAVRARQLREHWGSRAVAVTLGAEGVGLVTPHRDWVHIRTSAHDGRDNCGAGDRFAAAVTAALARSGGGDDDVTLRRAVEEAVSVASRFVVDGAAGMYTADPVEDAVIDVAQDRTHDMVDLTLVRADSRA
jgi:D-beta-D-heptose 7-phosphate kinase / D-beta-D-heptose 1-phosphate adenosyltransferase